MAYPLIIFGAGASYDYSSAGKGQRIAPLTKDLVNDDFLPPDLLSTYHGVGDLLAEIIPKVKGNGQSFEEVLTKEKERTFHLPPMRKQFIALEFYLKALFERISKSDFIIRGMSSDDRGRMNNMNNYGLILNRIKTYTENRACIVTFNYDTLFEQALHSNTPQSMIDYIKNDIKIIKLHGSHDWGYAEYTNYQHARVNNNFEWCLKFPASIDEMRDNKEPRHMQEIKIAKKYSKDPMDWFPAIAMPLIGKDKHICPADHIKKLEEIIPLIDRILVIGWRAADSLLLETLKKYLQPMGYKMLVVSSNLEEAKQIAKKINNHLKAHEGRIAAWGGNGFSDFMNSDESHDFFSS